jgi:hypothetical protein
MEILQKFGIAAFGIAIFGIATFGIVVFGMRDASQVEPLSQNELCRIPSQNRSR